MNINYKDTNVTPKQIRNVSNHFIGQSSKESSREFIIKQNLIKQNMEPDIYFTKKEENAKKIISENKNTKAIKEIVKDSFFEDYETLYLKTEFKYNCYNIYIYSNQTHAIVGKSFPVNNFLDDIMHKRLELKMNALIKKMVLEVKDSKNIYNGPKNTDEVIWID